MGKSVQVTCDGCGGDLTTRSNSVDYRLVLCSESKPGHGGGLYTDMTIYPPVDRDYYFCGLQCLDHWRNRCHHKQTAWAAKWSEWKTQNGTDHGNGFFSYPEMPQSDRERLEQEFAAAALVAFPMERPRL